MTDVNPNPATSPQPAPESPAPSDAPPDPTPAAPNTSPETTSPPSAPTAAPVAPGEDQAAVEQQRANAPTLRFGQLVRYAWDDPTGSHERYGLVAGVLSGADAPERAEILWLGERSGPIEARHLEVVED